MTEEKNLFETLDNLEGKQVSSRVSTLIHAILQLQDFAKREVKAGNFSRAKELLLEAKVLIEGLESLKRTAPNTYYLPEGEEIA